MFRGPKVLVSRKDAASLVHPPIPGQLRVQGTMAGRPGFRPLGLAADLKS